MLPLPHSGSMTAPLTILHLGDFSTTAHIHLPLHCIWVLAKCSALPALKPLLLQTMSTLPAAAVLRCLYISSATLVACLRDTASAASTRCIRQRLIYAAFCGTLPALTLLLSYIWEHSQFLAAALPAASRFSPAFFTITTLLDSPHRRERLEPRITLVHGITRCVLLRLVYVRLCCVSSVLGSLRSPDPPFAGLPRHCLPRLRALRLLPSTWMLRCWGTARGTCETPALPHARRRPLPAAA